MALTSKPLAPGLQFNWVFLIELVVCGILTLFFLFYFNRLFARLVSYGIRAYTWHTYRVWIDIQALQISLLAGRVFFKGFRYHGDNETILIHGGHITWRYWLRKVRAVKCQGDAEELSRTNQERNVNVGEKSALRGSNELPCRILVSIHGLEWFIYNRSAAYDYVRDSLLATEEADNGTESRSSNLGEAATTLDGGSDLGIPEKAKVCSSSSSSHGAPELKGRVRHVTTSSGEKHTKAYNDCERPTGFGPDNSNAEPVSPRTPGTGREDPSHTANRGPKPDPVLMDLLPIHVQCNKGAVVMGNWNTKSILVGKFEKAHGDIDASHARHVDQYKQLFNFHFTRPIIQMKHNPEYSEGHASRTFRAQKANKENPSTKRKHGHGWLSHHNGKKLWYRLRQLIPFARSSSESVTNTTGRVSPGSPEQPGVFSDRDRWRGLSRYLDESQQDEHDQWESVEYAKFSTVADCPSAEMSFYWDVAGLVQEPTEGHHRLDREAIEDINGDIPPEWGVDLVLRGGTVYYGPWTDRQRADLQNMFFPRLYKDSKPAKKLKPGQPRVSTVFKLFITLEEQAVLRIPTREESKDWKWKGRARTDAHIEPPKRWKSKKFRRKTTDKGTIGPDVRPFGWLDIKVMADSTISYAMDMVAGRTGYKNSLNLDLRGSELSTSVNHGLLWRCEHQTISCDLSNPLNWNALHIWNFNVMSRGLELFILREHIFLLTDLINDWGSGPLPDYYTYTPFHYLANLEFSDFKIYLNANDSNIINNPSDLDDNTFIILEAGGLSCGLTIPLDKFRPTKNEVPFDLSAHTLGVNLHTPPWNTKATFLDSNVIARVKEGNVNGRYTYCASTSTSNTDTLILDVQGSTVSIDLYGFLIRYLLKLRENYFGENIHFKTLEEFQDIVNKIQNGVSVADAQAEHHKKSNDLDVILSIEAQDATALLPANIYSTKEHVRLDMSCLNVDLRFTNYYMDLEVKFSPLAVSHGSLGDEETTPVGDAPQTQAFVDGVSVYGHRLFGLPPTEPTYVCNWDFDIGSITGEASSDFLRTFGFALRAFAFTFDDDENALPSAQQNVLHDVTFLRANVRNIKLWLHVEESAFLFSTKSINVQFNDWAQISHSDLLTLTIPDLTLACVDGESASRHRTRPLNAVKTHAFFETTVVLTLVQRKHGFTKRRSLQQKHIKQHDQRTGRTPFLILDKVSGDTGSTTTGQSEIDPPAMPFPPVPGPLLHGTRPIEDDSSYHSGHIARTSSRSLSPKSSFLSEVAPSSSSGTSVVRSKPTRSSSFHSAPESTSHARRRPDLSMTRMTNTSPERPASASAATRNSVHSVELLDAGNNGLPPSSITFSSAFIAPYFPLLMVEPDLGEVPQLPALQETNHHVDDPVHDAGEILPGDFDEDAVQTSFLVNFKSGIRAYFNLEAVESVVSLLENLQPKAPIDILDDLQIGSISKIFDLQKQKVRTGKVTDFSVKLPFAHIRFANYGQGAPQYSPKHVTSEYNATLDRLSVSGRSRVSFKMNDTVVTGNQQDSLHVLFESLTLSAKCRSRKSKVDAGITARIQDLVFWVVSQGGITANLNVKAMELAMESRFLNYLANLIHFSDLLMVDLAARFSKIGHEQKSRLQGLVFDLASAGQTVPDPAFLTRPSYVLRSAPNHLRSNDSWKIVSRFRHIYRCLAETKRNEISRDCYHNSVQCPQDAQTHVISGLDQWRNWELAHVKKSYAIQKIYGAIEDDPSTPKGRQKSDKTSLMLGSFRFMIDPGPKQIELSLDGLVVAIGTHALLKLQNNIQLGISSNPSARTTTVQVHSRNINITLNWELCELIEEAVNLYNDHDQKPVAHTSKSLASGTDRDYDQHYHLIMSIETGSLSLDSINIRCISLANGLKMSLIGADAAHGRMAMTALLSASTTSSELVSHSRILLKLTLQRPSIYLSLDRQSVTQSILHTWRLATNCEGARFQLCEEIIELIGVADLVIGDEVAHILRLLRKNQATQEPRSTLTETGRKSAHEVHVALFLDFFEISVALIQSLEYVCSGAVARMSIAPRDKSALLFDFDVKEHRHEIRTMNDEISESISLLNMPPVNGRIRSQSTPKEQFFEVFLSFESIALDGAAVHGLLNAFRKPEVANTLDDIKSEIKSLSAQAEHVFGKPTKLQKKKTPMPPVPLVYEVHVIIAGFSIRESAPDADLNMSFGCIQMNAANKMDPHGKISELPEGRIALRHIMFELSRSGSDSPQSCGNLAFGAYISLSPKRNGVGKTVPALHILSTTLEINLFAETASTIVAVITHLQSRIKRLDLQREVKVLRTRFRRSRPKIAVSDADSEEFSRSDKQTSLFSLMYSLEMQNIQISWIVGRSVASSSGRESEDLVLSFKRIELAMRKENAARLMIEDFQLQMVPPQRPGKKTERSLNSALLPEVVFNVVHFATKEDRRLAFQAKGKSLDIRMTSQFILPASDLQRSIATASEKFRTASATWEESLPTHPGIKRSNPLGNKRLASLLVDADFAGAVVYMQGKTVDDRQSSSAGALHGARSPQHGRYGQFTQGDTNSSTTLRAPGVAFKVEYLDDGNEDPSFNAEIKVDASSNILYPTVVPLILEVSSSVQDIVRDDDQSEKSLIPKPAPQKFLDDDTILTADPTAILGRTRLNVGLRICRQEFSLSCQPIARVSATARIDDFYITINTVKSSDLGHFFAISATITQFEASVQHVYSRESTGSFEVSSIVLSLLNSKHVSGTSGISAILKVSPMKAQINAKQLQDFLLFREIWVPAEIRKGSSAPVASPTQETAAFSVQRYQQVAAAGAFPWNATIAIAELDVQLDLGQSLGKSAFIISNFWISSKKTSDWEQSLCIGFDKTGISSTGRMSGFIELQGFKVRTSIQWPSREQAFNQTPLVQASIGFDKLRVKTAFEYQAFLIADITAFGFLMYNVRDGPTASGDRLVATLDGERVQVYFTTNSAAQGYALYQAFLRLVQEKRSAYDTSIREIEKFLRRKSASNLLTRSQELTKPKPDGDPIRTPIRLHTDVVVCLKVLSVGAFPSTFQDTQLFKAEALDAEARFAVTMDGEKIHSGLGLTLGQLRVALSAVKHETRPQTLSELSVEEVVSSATGSRGGTILKVPKLVATMQTWQTPESNKIDYIFRSSFEGKVDVGWNYSRISYIRGMWANHSRSLALRLGKPISQSTLTITGGPQPEMSEDGKPPRSTDPGHEQEKITAVVNVPQSRYEYTALEPPIIETPQLRDMGEATPPLEWIGLHRERLPNLTHQIVIVSLLEVAKEVEDAYERILGSS